MDDQQAHTLGIIIRNARQAKGWSLDTLADCSGIPTTWLFGLEGGRFRQPAPERLAQLSEVLNIDPAIIDQVSQDHLASNLPSVRTYFRSKAKATPRQIAEIEAAVEEILIRDERGDTHERNSRTDKGST